jgi:hypothetical protein
VYGPYPSLLGLLPQPARFRAAFPPKSQSLEAQRVWPVACFLSLQLQNGVYMTTKITSIDAEIKRRKAALESDPRRQLRIL